MTDIEVFDAQECNTCRYYEPEEGFCMKLGGQRHGYDGSDCDEWRDWENVW